MLELDPKSFRCLELELEIWITAPQSSFFCYVYKTCSEIR